MADPSRKGSDGAPVSKSPATSTRPLTIEDSAGGAFRSRIDVLAVPGRQAIECGLAEALKQLDGEIAKHGALRIRHTKSLQTDRRLMLDFAETTRIWNQLREIRIHALRLATDPAAPRASLDLMKVHVQGALEQEGSVSGLGIARVRAKHTLRNAHLHVTEHSRALDKATYGLQLRIGEIDDHIHELCMRGRASGKTGELPKLLSENRKVAGTRDRLEMINAAAESLADKPVVDRAALAAMKRLLEEASDADVDASRLVSIELEAKQLAEGA